jgi:hypothetical protein
VRVCMCQPSSQNNHVHPSIPVPSNASKIHVTPEMVIAFRNNATSASQAVAFVDGIDAAGDLAAEGQKDQVCVNHQDISADNVCF